MLDVNAVGRSGAGSPASAAGKANQARGGFDDALRATRRQAGARVTGDGTSPAEAGFGGARQGEGRCPAAAGTLAARCRADLDALEAGESSDAARARLREAYDQLISATEERCGHLPHDSLARILAMAEYAEKEEGGRSI